MTLPLFHPCSVIVTRHGQVGKSIWVSNLFANKDRMRFPSPEIVYVCYKEYQPLYNTFTNVNFYKGMDMDNLDRSVRKLIIYDDIMEQVNSEMSELFTKFVHHRHLSWVFLKAKPILQKSAHSHNESKCQLLGIVL